MSKGPDQSGSFLITGGTGFIGSHLARKLLKTGKRVVLFDLFPNRQRITDIAGDVEIVEGDVASQKDIIDTIEKYEVDTVFHTAAMLSVAAATDLKSAYQANIEGTFSLLEACRTTGVEKVIFLSSLAVFGPDTSFPFHVKSYRGPASFYGVGKVCGEVMGTFYHHEYGMDFRCVRLAVVIGPGRRGQGATVSFSKFVEDVVLNESAVIMVPDYTVLPVIHVDDATDFLVALWKAPKVSQQIFMSGGVPVPIEGFVEEVKKHVAGGAVSYEVDPDAEQVASTWTLLTTMLVNQGQDNVFREVEEIGWKLKHDTLEDIAKVFVQEIRENKDMYSTF
jgi:nucleoside-diphosphate-sugar epimerase